MSKDQAIADAKTKLAQAQDDALGALYDTAVSDTQPVSGFTQADVDAAVAKATADDQTHITDLQSQLQLEEGQMAQVKAAATAALQQALQILGVAAAN